MVHTTSMSDPVVVLALLVGAGVAAQWLAVRLRVPAILLLLILGFIIGPLTGIFRPDPIFGDLLFPGISLGVAIILFEGALTLRFVDIKGAGRVVLRLITLGVLITVGVVAAVTHWALGLSWSLSLLFGAIVSVTGPTVVIPMLRAVRPTEHVSQILRWEGILIDPIGAVLAVIIFEAILADITLGAGDNSLLLLLQTLAAGTISGAIGGFGLGAILKRHLLPDFLINVGTLAAVLLIFAAANVLAPEAGLVAVTVMGITLCNLKRVPTDRILDFKESLSVLLISVLFIILAARIDIAALTALGPGLAIVLAGILFLARPLSILVCTMGTHTAWRERALLAWMAPRGIIAAAISALFALQLESAGLANASLLVGLTFSAIIVTVVLQSLTARPFARLLGIAQPESRGVLMVGGNPAALAVAEALMNNGVEVLVADTSWPQVRAARMRGLPTFFGNPVSEYADRRLDLVGLGMLMALSRRPALNDLACVRYRPEFGSGRVYTVRRSPDTQDREAEPPSFGVRGHFLFKPAMTLEALEERIAEGYTIKVTELTEDFDFDALVERIGDETLLLFSVAPDGVVYPFAEEPYFRAVAGWSIGYLVPPEDSAPVKKQRERAEETDNGQTSSNRSSD